MLGVGMCMLWLFKTIMSDILTLGVRANYHTVNENMGFKILKISDSYPAH